MNWKCLIFGHKEKKITKTVCAYVTRSWKECTRCGEVTEPTLRKFWD